MKFRKKPVVIEAHRLGDDGWPDAIWEGVNQKQILLHLGRDGAKRVTGHADIHTVEGTMRAAVGDYIIRGVKGEFYPCKSDIFAATYEAVESATSDPARVQSDAPAQGERLRDSTSSLVLSSSSLRTLVEAAKNADWMTVVLNQGPPCFHLESSGQFCLRAQRWAGHTERAEFPEHRYVSLADLLAALLSPVAVEETHEDTFTRTGDDGLSTSSRTASTDTKG